MRLRGWLTFFFVPFMKICKIEFMIEGGRSYSGMLESVMNLI